MLKIPVSGGRFALVDDADKELLKHNWSAGVRGRRTYAVRMHMPTRRLLLMHRVVMGAKKGQIVDHINGDGLDNRRENLRIVTNAENSRNRALGANSNSRTGVLGVCRYLADPKKPWQASVTRDWKTISLGRFKTIEEAIEVRRKFIESNPL